MTNKKYWKKTVFQAPEITNIIYNRYRKTRDSLSIQTLNGIFETAQGSRLRKGVIVSPRFKQLHVIKYTVQLP